MIYNIDSPVVFKVTGKDSLRYLHARLTSNIKNLKNGFWIPSAALSPNGKTDCIINVFKIDDENFYLISDGYESEICKLGVSKFIVADQVFLEDISSQVTIEHQINKELKLDFMFNKNLETVEFNNKRTALIGKDIIYFNKKDKLDNYQELNNQRIKAFIPKFNIDFNEKLIFTESKLYSHISENKGCYAGQEVIEKIISVGRTNYSLFGFETKDLKNLTNQAISSKVKEDDSYFGIIRIKNKVFNEGIKNVTLYNIVDNLKSN